MKAWFHVDCSKTQFQYTFFHHWAKQFFTTWVMGLRKFQIVEKRSGLALFDYFSSRVWFFGMM